MSKRCVAFARNPRDLYLTPASAVKPLAPHLGRPIRFVEPCAADGGLARHLEALGHPCAGAFDIEPLSAGVTRADALALDLAERGIEADMFITNPPWTRPVMHAMIEALSAQRPLWALFDADWAHTNQAARLLPHCGRIVSVGRVKWISGSRYTGKDHATLVRIMPPGTFSRPASVRPSSTAATRPLRPSVPIVTGYVNLWCVDDERSAAGAR